ncbi:MAG: ankyrin repeat domain-containing protein [Pyramidobacter sp.]|nr:ankyrin repeat domain-containing protein [Pyramidobacter sp.]
MKRLIVALLLLVFCAAARATVPDDPPTPQERLIGEQELWEILRRGKTLEIMGAMLAKPPLEGCDAKGRTPLLWAIWDENEPLAVLLINAGADVENRGAKEGNTPLICAVEEGMKSAAKLLIEKGADVNAKGDHGTTPLHAAVE